MFELHHVLGLEDLKMIENFSEIHIHLKEDQNRKEVADLDLKSNSVYAVRQDYSYKLVNAKEPSKTRYGRQFRTSYNMHLKGSQNMIVHDTG